MTWEARATAPAKKGFLHVGDKVIYSVVPHLDPLHRVGTNVGEDIYRVELIFYWENKFWIAIDPKQRKCPQEIVPTGWASECFKILEPAMICEND